MMQYDDAYLPHPGDRYEVEIKAYRYLDWQMRHTEMDEKEQEKAKERLLEMWQKL